jgi:hypothetical protein
MTLQSRCPGLNSTSRCPDQYASSSELSKHPIYLPVGCGDSRSPSKWQAGSRSSQRKTHIVRHRSPENLRVHSRNVEIILLPPSVECIDGVLEVTVPGAVLSLPTKQCLPSKFFQCHGTSLMRVGQACLPTTSDPLKTSTV